MVWICFFEKHGPCDFVQYHYMPDSNYECIWGNLMNWTEFLEHQFYYSVPIHSYLKWAALSTKNTVLFVFVQQWMCHTKFSHYSVYCSFEWQYWARLLFTEVWEHFFSIMQFESTATERSLFKRMCFSQALTTLYGSKHLTVCLSYIPAVMRWWLGVLSPLC